MSDTDGSIARRRVLKVAGSAVGATVAGTGVAVADHLSPGDCAVLQGGGAYAYSTACPTGSVEEFFQGGSQGQVLNTCTDADGVEWAYFSPGQTILPAGWVHASLLEPC